MKKENIENIYRLSPIQQGMLFHTLYAPGEGVYFEQFNMTFGAGFEPAIFERTWQDLVARNPILRTSFIWESLEEPVQVVNRQVELPFEVLDWRGLPEAEKEPKLQERIAEERRRGFDLLQAPLIRFCVIRLRDDLYHVIWSYHHLILDGWSVGLLLQDANALYRAAVTGGSFQPQPRRPFRDYIAWLRQLDLSAIEGYWRRVLGGFTTPTPLGVDRPAGRSRPEESGRDMKFALVPEAESEALKAWARENRLTISTVLQGAWSLVLSRYSGEDDLVFGVTVSGRPPSLSGVDTMLGCFINTLPVRVRVPGGAPVRAWLQSLQADQLEMRRYEQSPLVQVLGWSDVPRPTPLFESIFVFEGFMETAREGVFQRTGYPLTLVAGPDREIVLRIDYELERFEPAVIARLLGHMRSVLPAFLANPEQRLDEIDILTASELRQVREWSATAVRYGGADLLLHEIIAARMASQPDAVAVVFGEESLTYRELGVRAGRLARRLRRLGVGPEVLVGVCAERSLEMVVALLAVLEAGGGYVPLDPSYPADRLAYMLEDSLVPVLLAQEAVLDRLPASEARVVLLDAEAEEDAAAGEEGPAAAVTPGNVAYMIYTSGSTGRPKGAMNTHRAIVNRLLWMQDALGLDATDRVLQKTPFSFDVSVWEFFWPLMMGARLVMAKPGGHQDPDYLVEEIARQGVTTLHFVPSMLQVFLEARGLERCAALRRVVCSGEALPAELARRFYEVFAAPLINLYGPTEAAVDVSCWWCARGDDRATVPIGRPVANTELHVLDRAGRRLPIGVAGELFIGGIQVGRGYHRRPELTAEKFVPDPFGGAAEDRAGARLYRTGDLARHLPDGAIEFLGRIDHQVKIRGLRIELGEIEAALTAHPSVREAVVVATPDQRLVGYVVAAAGAEAAPAELRAHLAATLPEYMVPAVFVPLEALPLSPNGKVDRRALPAPGTAASSAAEASASPRTPLEEMIAGVWSEVLKVGKVGRDDNFFELGGHSLLATRVLSRLRETLGIDVPLRALFEATTVARQAALMEEMRLTAGKLAMPPLRRVSREGEIPLSFGQERFWFIDRLQPGSAAYNIPGRVRIAGRLDTPALMRAFAEVVRRHEGLRTVFPLRKGRASQVIRPEVGTLPLVDLRGLPEAARERERRHLVQLVSQLPFDLARGPLYRFMLLRVEDEAHVLLLTVHHIVSDGWSMGVLVREIGALYEAFSAGRPSPLPELPLQYADFAAWQREWLQGEVLEAQIDFWRQRLAGAPPVTNFPLDHPRPALQTYRGDRRALLLTPELTDGLKALGRRQGVTLFMVLLAVLDTLLVRHGGQEDLVIGSPIAGRGKVEVEGLIGLFLNMLLLRVDASGNPSFAALLLRVRESALSAYAHQDLPFEKLVDELAPERNLSQTAFFQVLLVLQNAPLEPLVLPGITLSPVTSDAEAVKLDFTLDAIENSGKLVIALRFNPDLFEATTIERLAGHLQRLLETVVSHPERPIHEIPLLSEGELQQLREWSATAVHYPGDLLLHRLIEAQVDRDPEAVAVVAGEASLTYRELDRRANGLARRLREKGVGPEVPVGVCAERSLEMVVALLAVLKAGGGYVPLDPSYPADRLAFMLASAGTPVLLVQPALLERLPEHGAEVIPLVEGEEGAEDLRPAVEIDPDGLAYAIFTSGSTGRPKGAMNSHRGIVNRLLWMQETFGLDATDRVLQKTPFSFDVSVWEFFWPLMTGARLVMAKPGGHQDPAYLVEEIVAQEITTLHFVPSMLQVFLEARGVGRCGSLRRVLCSGEALPAELARRFYELLDAPLHNLYGPTEAAVDVSWWPCERGSSRAAVPIGRPVANTGLRILGREGELMPVGVAGELWIGGVQVGRGYLGRPELTAERFVPDPFGPPGSRAYRTGDLTRFLPDGAIEFLGRIDFQVKIRGFRIELGEIEAALTGQGSVREAVVVADRSTGTAGAVGDWRLIAYVVAAAGAEVTVADLRSHLGTALPEYMIPSVFVLLDALPLNPNGKVDRKALPAPDFEATGAAAEYVAPRTVLETGLARLWSEVLGVEVERIGLRDHFFDLGGNSITGAIFVNQLQEMLGEIIHVVALFDAPVLERFAAFVAREYPAGVARVWGEEVAEGSAAPVPEPTVDEERLAQIRWHLRTLAPAALDGIVNPPALFVLSPPRSGSTLLRVMLGGNPQLFAPPELELLNFNTLRERREAFPGRDSFRLEGLLRAVVEVQGITPEEAATLVEQLEWNGTTAQEAYRILQERIAPRLLVDKTPTYAWDPATLRRAEEMFGGARYLHLVRHPYGTIHSFEEARIDQIFFAEDHSFDRRELAEALWGIAHQNILDFLAEVPPERQQTIRFEDLLKDPEGVLRGVCASLGIDYHPDMAEPYRKRRARMTDGLHAESRMLGDVKFHEHRGVDAAVAERWREAYDHDFLGEATWRLAARLGYDTERERVGVIAGLEGEAAVLEAGGWREGEPLPLSFSQERLWFLDQLDPGTRTYNVSMSVRLLGRLDVPVLGRSLEEIARRHAALRTTFAAAQGNPVQIVGPEPRLEPQIVDLSALPAAARDLAVRDAVAAYGGEPFDLAGGPLIRALLVRMEAEDHVASFTAHHIVCDGWSIGVLVREVAALYAAFVAGEPSPLPALPVQYADFARWQRRWLEGAAIERQLAYWRERLAGVPVLQLPGDRPRPSVQSFRGSTHGFVLSGELSASLRTLSRERGATSFMTVMAAFQAFLGRYSGQEDFAVGSPVAGRNRRELEPLIGFFVNTLVLRADLAGAPGFAALLERVRRTALEGYAHQDVPFEKVVQEIAPERNLSYPPLFQVMLAFQNAPAGRFELPGLTLAPVAEDFAVSKFDLSLTVFDNGPQIFGQWVYSTALFEAETIARWAGHFQTLLTELTADPARRVAELPLLTAPEREQLLVEWNRPPADYPDEGFVHRLVEEQAARTPEAAAVVFEGESLGYGELNARANRLARHLRELGVGPESVVGISAERSFEMVVGLLAILKAGGAYLPLDPALPAERLAFMMEDAGIGLLLAQERLVPDLPARGGLRIVLLDSLDGPVTGSPEDLGVPVLPENPAYVIYTSGSTGQPKGVVVSHRALGNRLQYARTGDVTAADAFLQKTTISFDVSLLEIFAPLAAGGRTVLARPGGQQDAAYLVDLIREQGITYASFPPALLSVLFEQPGFDRCTSLRTVVTGGETVPAPLPGQFYAVLPGADLLNRYGPTEATISVTSWLCERGAPPRTLPIGRPTAKARVYLLDRELQPVPVGMPGEIFLGGLCVARGYLSQPALTAEKFVPDPFSEDAGQRLYRTGDLARYRPDGAIEFAGRVDQQVKIRGFRVELGEIEAVLARHPAVREVAVVDREDGPTRSLAAYLAFQPGEAPEEGELRRFLLAALPPYMVPADFVVMAALPLAPTGKVDRRALPAPERRSAAAGFAAPRNPAEERLAAIWAALLARETVGIHDSFFDLGGHSLLATQVISRVRESFGVELPLRLLFERPTVAALAEAVDAALVTGSGPEAPPLVPVPRGGDLPLSFAQQRLWFLEQLQPGTATYNMPAAVRFRGALDVAALRESLREVMRRHESLRTTFAVRGGTPVQVVSALELDLPVIDLGALPEEEREAAVRRLAGEEARRPFDLGAGPLIRATLLRAGEDEHVVLLTLHHIVADGWSIGVLIGELGALYPALLAGAPSPLPGLAVQYGDFAVWQRQWLRGEVLASQLAYWRRVLAGHAVLQLPTDRPRPAVQQFRGADEPLAFGREASRAFLDLGRRQGATSYMTLLAGFQALLYRYSGQDDVIVGATVAGRDRRELEPLIGFFVNTLPMRTDLSGRPAFRELLDRVREVALGALSHQDLPFEKLVEELQPERDLSRSPLFQVVLQFQQAAAAVAPLELPGLTLSPVEGSSQSAKFDVVLNLREGAGGLLGVWKFNTDLFDRSTLARMSRHFETLIAGAAADPDRSLAELPILTEAERRQLGLEERRTEALGGPCLHEIFAAQAARAPEAIAVTCDGEGLSYGELDRGANRLAHHLIAAGVAPGDLVGLCLERSADMVVAILAVLKAGGAYVPLDPAYPRERLAFMLEDSRVPVLIAQESLATALPEPGPGTRVILLDRDRERILGESAGDPRVSVAADYPAYVIYTSGSTGQPKGVVVRHGNAARLFTATEPWFGFGPEDVWTLFHSYAFDFSVWELWGALLHGGRLVVVPYWVSRSPEAFYDLLATERVTVLNQTPSAFRQLIWAEESALGGAAPDLALRYVVFGGEALEPASLAPWFERHGDQTPRLINMYGITETTVHVTYRPIGWAEVAGAGSVIGRPIPDLGLYVLDAAAQPLPAGVPGEIHVGGAGLALGYLGRPELTAERFVPDPYGEPGSRLYRSGDLARFLADGDVEYLGRIDHQVKIRGFRIELGEIESALAAHPAVREAVVLAREEGAERRLVAYVVPAGGDAPSLAELREALAATLPEYMLPSSLVALERMPLTANGKVDRRALPAPGAPGAVLEASYVPPANDLERFLADLWQEVLKVPRVGVHDDFFAVGGSSITGAVLVSRLQEKLREIVHVVVIFDHPTIAEMSAYLIDQHPEGVARLFGRGALGSSGGRAAAVEAAGDAELAELRSLIRPLAPLAQAPAKNPRAVFVLSPPRSGSTLMRVMLGGHPRLFSPPELELLTFNTLQERRAAFSGRDAFWLEGVIRAVMEIRGCDAEEAEALVAGCEREGLTALEFYGRLQEWLGDRILVDKTPSYALDPAVLRRAEEGFEEPRYIHLIRHPLGMIHSFEEAKLDQLFFRYEHPFSRRQLAELIWRESHENIVEFLGGVPAGRQHWVRFEDLLREPEAILRGICEFLGLEYHPDMAEPYKRKSARMTDGVHAESRMLGDVKFHQYQGVDARVAERWRESHALESLDGGTRGLAARLGYDVEPEEPGERWSPISSVLVGLQPGGSEPPLFLVHPLSGELFLYRQLVAALGPEQPVYGFQAVGFAADEEPLATVEEMAAVYVDALLSFQPQGPYLLAGSSLGGLIAFEMARKLRSLQREVAFLALLDAPDPARFARRQEDAEGDAELSILQHVAQGAPGVSLDDLRALAPEERLELILDHGRRAGTLAGSFGLPELRRLVRVVRANRQAVRAYEPQPFDTGLFYIRAEGGLGDDAVWAGLALGGAEVHEAPGNHLSMHFPPHAGTLAARLRGCIERALRARVAEAGDEGAGRAVET